MVALGVLFSLYFISRFRGHEEDTMQGLYSKIGATCGLVSCGGLIFTALVPSNLVPLLHSNATAVVTVPMMPMMLAFTISTWMDHGIHISRKFILLALLVTIMVASIILLLERGDFAGRESISAILSYNASQKIMVYSWLAFISVHVIIEKTDRHAKKKYLLKENGEKILEV